MTETTTSVQTLYMPIAKRELVQIALLGVAVGLIAWALTNLLDTYVYQALLCRSTSDGQCADTITYASITAAIIAAIVGLIGLIRLRLFRPLLVVLAAMLSVWNLNSLLADANWYWVLLASVGMYAIAYCVFAWIARLTNFFAALIVMVVLTVIVRLILS